MDEAEIHNMATLEGEHWWYRGLRGTIERTLAMRQFVLPAGARVLDAGCGTGANLGMLLELLKPSYAGGFDISPCAVQYCRERLGPGADVYVGDIQTPEVHVAELDLVVSCDVISIAGTEESRSGLQTLVSKLRRGGLFILNLAACRWLFSSHDVITHTRERFTLGQVRRLMMALGLRVELITYRLFWLFPAIVLRRLPSMLFRPDFARAHSDLSRPSAVVNACLSRSMGVENWLLARGMRYPWGSSVFAVGRKEAPAW